MTIALMNSITAVLGSGIVSTATSVSLSKLEANNMRFETN